MFGRYSISTRLTWMNLLVTAAALTLACFSFLAYDQVSARSNLVDNLSSQAQIIASNSASSLIFNDPQSAQSTLAALGSSRNVEWAGLFTPDGRVFAEYKQRPGTLTVLPSLRPEDTELHAFTANHLLLGRNIEFQGKRVGSIYLRSDLEQIYTRQSRFLRILLIVVLVSMIAALIASGIFRRAVARPIVDLAETARVVSREKNYSIRAKQGAGRDELAVLISAFNDMLSEIQRRDAALSAAHSDLERRVDERTKQLRDANRDLESFSYSVSHDLRSPLEVISGMSYIVLTDYGKQLDLVGKDCLERINQAARRMAQLIDDLLNLARVSTLEMTEDIVDLSAMSREVASDLRQRNPGREVKIAIQDGMFASGDARLLRVALDNLIGNAWKYTSQVQHPEVKIGATERDGKVVMHISDNGAGFDPQRAARLFQPFTRLHSMAEFPGTGIGLATVQRIVQKHGGQIWANAAVNKGATFTMTLPAVPVNAPSRANV